VLKVRVVYDYQAQGSDELTVKAGDLLELTGGPTGGQNYGDGWWEGEYLSPFDSHARKDSTGCQVSTPKVKRGHFRAIM
jgi:hypothetical protein